MAALIVKNLETGVKYQLKEQLGEGGYGVAFRAVRKVAGEPDAPVCVKISTDLDSWITEVHFGNLLNGQPRVIQVYDHFVAVQADWTLQYVLVTELAHGTIEEYLKEHGRMSKAKAVTEVVALLKVLALLHSISTVHRDLTPQNVLVADTAKLKLADFGIAKVLLPGKRVQATAANWWMVNTGFKGAPGDDVYLIGQLLAKLLTGNCADKLSVKDVRASIPDDRLVNILERSIGPRTKRFKTALAMLGAIAGDDTDEGDDVRSLKNKCVVFTGPLTVRRADAELLVLQAGGRVSKKITQSVDVIVVGGNSPHYHGGNRGVKLLAVDALNKQGAGIKMIGEVDFLKLVST